jgi:hypothetical protein
MALAIAKNKIFESNFSSPFSTLGGDRERTLFRDLEMIHSVSGVENSNQDERSTTLYSRTSRVDFLVTVRSGVY